MISQRSRIRRLTLSPTLNSVCVSCVTQFTWVPIEPLFWVLIWRCCSRCHCSEETLYKSHFRCKWQRFQIQYIKSLSMRKPFKTAQKQGWPILFKIWWQMNYNTPFTNVFAFFLHIFEYHDHRRRHLYLYNFPINMTRN